MRWNALWLQELLFSLEVKYTLSVQKTPHVSDTFNTPLVAPLSMAWGRLNAANLYFLFVYKVEQYWKKELLKATEEITQLYKNGAKLDVFLEEQALNDSLTKPRAHKGLLSEEWIDRTYICRQWATIYRKYVSSHGR